MQTILQKKESRIFKFLPLVNHMEKLFQNIRLENICIICVQHLYATTYTMFKTLINLGLKPDNLFVLGKCYSTDPRVFAQLKLEKVHVSSNSTSFNSHLSYDQESKAYTVNFFDDFLHKVNLKNFEKIIILDDGGDLIDIVSKNTEFTDLDKIIAIEQTSAGYNKLKQRNLSFPIINLARAKIKLQYETPIIINLVKRKLLEKINFLKIKIKKVLIIGGGAIGKVAYTLLKDRFEMTIFDMNSSRSTILQKNLKKEIARFDLILGCTGTTSIPKSIYKYLKNPVILASISSSDREFEALHLRKKCKLQRNCHVDLNIDNIYLLNCGFPINFDDDFAKIDTDEFQFTRALILASIYQAINTPSQKNGFLNLSQDLQDYIMKGMNKLGITNEK